MFTRYPEFWGNLIEFESVWALCRDAINQAINQACKYARVNLQKKILIFLYADTYTSVLLGHATLYFLDHFILSLYIVDHKHFYIILSVQVHKNRQK